MFRSMRIRKARRGYVRLISEPTVDDRLSEPLIIRSTTFARKFFGDLLAKFVSEPKVPVKVHSIEKRVKKLSRVDPIFSLFEKRIRKKKPTAKPEFARYMQYLKEGGSWNPSSLLPEIY